MAKSEKKSTSEWLAVTGEASAGSHYKGLFKRVNALLSVPSRRRRAVTTGKLNSTTKTGDNVIVPTKVLYAGNIDHKITISALEFSAKAEQQIKESGGSIVGIKEMVGKSKISLIV